MEQKPSTFEYFEDGEVSEMELKSNTELIIALKHTIAEKNIGQAELMKMLAEHGHPIAKTTIQRFYKEGSEVNDSFRYKDTLQPMAELLLPDEEPEEDPILELKERIDELTDQMKEIYEMASKGMSFMRSQIDIKDNRMERKDAWIQALMDENKRLNDDICKLLERCQLCDKRK